MPWVAAAVAVVGAIVGGVSAADQARQTRHANADARKMAALQAQRERLDAIKQERAQMANLEAGAQGSSGSTGLGRGSTSGSGLSGAETGLSAQTGSNISFANQIDTLNQQRLRALSGADTARTWGQVGATISSTSGAIAAL